MMATKKLPRHFGPVVFLSAALIRLVVMPACQSSQPASALQTSQTDTMAVRVADPMLVSSPVSSTGFALVEGNWEFPGLEWQISGGTTQLSPEEVLEKQSLVSSSAMVPDHSEELDWQLLMLIRQLMSPASSDAGSRQHYTLRQKGLRGAAVCEGKGTSEQPMAVCLQWPAADGDWSQTTLQRTQSLQQLPAIIELPPGSVVTAQRRDAQGRVRVQAAEVRQNAVELQRHLEQHQWNISHTPELSACFWASGHGRLVEFTWRQTDSGSLSLLLRDLSENL
jgi:hypothetical protein